MIHGGSEDPRDASYDGEPDTRPTSQYHLSENEHVKGPPVQCTVSTHGCPVVVVTTHTTRLKAPPSSQYLGYAPWNAPPPHPGFQEPPYAAPYPGDIAPGNGAWHEARQIFPPSAESRYTDKGAGTTSGAIPRHWDSGNPTSATCVYAPPLASNSQPDYMPGAGQGPTSAPNIHSGASTSAQPYATGIDAPVPSEFLRSLARRLILDRGTHVNVLNAEASGSGRLKVTITLETADIV
ncbi:hypothetical protein EI94DRAFT_1806809 [Lactarius quietus]|nr:hypothetical protein EI94DRAFT_1806809 [Lactarius quietus]